MWAISQDPYDGSVSESATPKPPARERAEEPAAQKPEPVAQKPVAQEPVTQKPVAQKQPAATGMPPGTLLRLRPSRVGLIVVLVLLVCMTPFAAQRSYLLPLYVIPVLVLWWLLRSGTEIDDSGITVSAMLGSRHWNWDELRGFSTTGRGALAAVLLDGRIVRLPSARARHLDLIAKVSDGRVPQI